MDSMQEEANQKDAQHWWISAIAGALLAFLLLQTPLKLGTTVPLWLTFPFVILLASIAITPLVHPKWWHNNYPNVSLFLGSFVACLYGLGFEFGPSKLLHSGHEYLSFMALVGGLFFVSSCIKLEIFGQGRPLTNAVFLACGAVLANILGTTGASMLLIRPFIKLNQGRMKPLHIVFFILIISNCGGSLTPVGDPPLYLGYLKGIPFNWTLLHLWSSWIFVIGTLLIVFFVYDFLFVNTRQQKDGSKKLSFKIEGRVGLVCLFLIIAAVFIDPLLSKQFGIHRLPISALTQILIALFCFFLTPHSIKKFNEFTFGPFEEVALLFAGIFATMLPALDYLSSHGASLGLNSSYAFFYGTGALSAVLDNAPTYLNFLQVAIGPNEITQASLQELILDSHGNHMLVAISTGAVFFGALTYIGNGPNFMVRSISESVGVKTPSFFGYFLSALCILGPILILHALIFL